MEIETLTLFSERTDMTLYTLFASLGIAVFLVSILGIFDKFPLRRSIISVFFMVALGVGYVAMGELLSRPKPVDILTWERPDVEDATILAQFLQEGKAIYLLLMYEGIIVPRYYQFPWNQEMAEKLQRGQRATALGDIQGMMLKFPFQNSLEGREHPEVYELPWPKPPEKRDPNEREVIDLDKMV